MKYCIGVLLLFSITVVQAQRPTTKAEHDEDARVLKTISQAMPKEIEEAPEPEERSNKGIGGNSLDITGIDGFHNNMNFATRNTFNHYYKIDYGFKKIPAELADKLNPLIAEAQAKADRASMEFIANISSCTVEVVVNEDVCSKTSLANFKKIDYPGCTMAYRELTGNTTVLFFGDKWKPGIKASDADGPNGSIVKEYAVCGNAVLQVGTVIQSIAIIVYGNADITDFILKQVDLPKIKALLGTGKIQDDLSESEFKKYAVEKPVAPVAGANTASFTYVDEDGNEKQFSASSIRHNLANCAILVNHNENLKVLENAETTFRLTDDQDELKSLNISVPVVRTTGTATATEQSDHDYEVMWGAVPGKFKGAQPFFPDVIDIVITKWAPPGDFIEGTFSGTATTADPADPMSSTRKKYTIKNGKFRLRRVADETSQAGMQ